MIWDGLIQQQYDKDHIAALSTYELARQALNRYNDLKKKGEDDVTLSQEEMAAYLKYKEMSLKAAEEGVCHYHCYLHRCWMCALHTASCTPWPLPG